MGSRQFSVGSRQQFVAACLRHADVNDEGVLVVAAIADRRKFWESAIGDRRYSLDEDDNGEEDED